MTRDIDLDIDTDVDIDIEDDSWGSCYLGDSEPGLSLIRSLLHLKPQVHKC